MPAISHARLTPAASRRAFTMIDVMIVVVVIGILAAAVLPLVSHYIDDAEEAAAQATFKNVRTALDLYQTQNGAWPPAITADLFQREEEMSLPPGYVFEYNPATGSLALVIVPE